MKWAMRTAPPPRCACAVELQEQLLGAAPDDPERLRDLAVSLDKLGALHAQRQPAKAIELYERAVALQKKASICSRRSPFIEASWL